MGTENGRKVRTGAAGWRYAAGLLLLGGGLILGQGTAWAAREVQGNAVQPSDRVIAERFAPTAAQLGAPELAFINVGFDRRAMHIGFLPPGQALDKWTHMVVVNLAVLPGDDEAKSLKAIDTTLETQRKVFSAIGEMRAFEVRDGDNGKAAFFEYVTGRDKQREHIAGVTWRADKTLLPTLTVQERPGFLPKAQVDAVKSMVIKP